MMLFPLEQYLPWLPVLLLMFFRINAMIMVLPILSYPVIPVRVRVLLAFAITIFILPMLTPTAETIDSIIVMVGMVIREIFVGLFIGFGVKMIFEAFNMAGSFVARQMGIGIANVMDPTSRQQIPVISQFWVLVIMAYFLAFDGHHLFITVLVKTNTLVAPSFAEFKPAVADLLVKSGSLAFDIGLKLALPAMIFLLLADGAIALTARVMPQMNIFLVTLPMKIGTGLFVLITSLDIFQIMFHSIYQQMTDLLRAMIGAVGAV
ncbi:MAG: flagellar biosynthetic protein FliR [Fidelibacterota bacterium]